MFKGTLGYILGIVFTGSILAFVVSILLDVLLYVAVFSVVLLPLWGALRHHKNWMHEGIGLKKWLSTFRKVSKWGKPRLTFYLIAIVVVGFSYGQITAILGYVTGGMIFMLIAWESVRYVLLKSKKVKIISFAVALKNVW
ncbi:hypothetical protein [Paenibacillus sp. DR312]|uniref:hypothetical protein n=1 Tax=unclassified Paenibacillus TaxID=185978 RepID=UPI001C987B9F|nr:hypothetical protein [Paenibacillus sp. DR312]QZN76185.1 hypothetical protein K5K90_02430 [Paenibacillus sp. DR312]